MGQDRMFKRVHIVVNPASGQDRPFLNIFNNAFGPAGIDWELKVTKTAGDARQYAQQAAAEGIDLVVAYGGDGTVMEVASGLIGTQTPLAIFPGGTANVMSVELGIPGDLTQAAALICGSEHEIRPVDMGQVNDHNFILRAGVGLEADLVEGARRDLKDRIGNLAYVISALQALGNSKIVRYQLTLDGKEIETEGITCMVCNSGNVGQPGLTLAPTINVSDGLLDVLVVRAGDIGSLLSVFASVVRQNEDAQPLQHWQGREIKVQTEEAQTVQADGEILGQTPVNVKIIPSAIRVVVPKAATPENAAAQAEGTA
jgi:diacylglycerol kinase (ATP)